MLGHSHCGAVTAAISGADDDPVIESLLSPIRPPVSAERCDDLACAVGANVRSTVADIVDSGGPIGDAVRSGHLAVHGAVLDLADQTITPLPLTPNRPDVTETPT